MEVTIIFWAVISIILLVVILQQDKENIRLSAENGVMKGRVEGMRETIAQSLKESVSQELLNIDSIAEAVRKAGYNPEVSDEFITFKASGDSYYIDSRRRPQLFISLYYNVQPEQFDMDLLHHAAHLMSDELIMVKALFVENGNETHLRFYIGAFERIYPSLRDNLKDYITLLKDGSDRMLEIYKELEAQKNDSTIKAETFIPASKQESSIIS